MSSAEIVLISLAFLVLVVCWRNSQMVHEQALMTAAALLLLKESKESIEDLKKDLKKEVTALESIVKEPRCPR